jgi:hypothetical protein
MRTIGTAADPRGARGATYQVYERMIANTVNVSLIVRSYGLHNEYRLEPIAA